MLARFFPQSHCQKFEIGEDGDLVAKAVEPTCHPSDRPEPVIDRKRSGMNVETPSSHSRGLRMKSRTYRFSPVFNVVGELEDRSRASRGKWEHGQSQEQTSRRYLNTLIRPSRT